MEMIRDKKVSLCLVEPLEHEQALEADDGHEGKRDLHVARFFQCRWWWAAIPQLFVILGEFAACHCRTRGPNPVAP